jgi:hypothetical protein
LKDILFSPLSFGVDRSFPCTLDSFSAGRPKNIFLVQIENKFCHKSNEQIDQPAPIIAPLDIVRASAHRQKKELFLELYIFLSNYINYKLVET